MKSQTVMAIGMTLCSHGKKTKEHIPSKRDKDTPFSVLRDQEQTHANPSSL